MTDRELMQQALEALELHAEQYPHMQKGYTVDAITVLRERLAQLEMQPCAGRNCGSTNPNLHSAECFEDYEKATGMNQRKPLPPQSPCEMTQAERKMFRLGWLECEAAHGIGEKPDAA